MNSFKKLNISLIRNIISFNIDHFSRSIYRFSAAKTKYMMKMTLKGEYYDI